MSFLPSREADLLAWSASFSAHINSLQPAGAFGLTPQQGTDYQAAHDLFAAKLALVEDGATNSSANRTAKNDAKAALIAMARELVGIIQRNPSTTNEDRATLVITIPDPEPTPVPVPSTSPALDVVAAVGRTVKLRAHDSENPTRRARPANTVGLAAYTYVGETAPVEISDWFFQGNFNTTTFDVEFPASTPSGSTVWITAFWIGKRLDSGPAASPISTNIPGGLAQAA